MRSVRTILAMAMALAVTASSEGPLAAHRLRVDGSNTHAATATAGTRFSIDSGSPTFTWAAEHAEAGAIQSAFNLTVLDLATGAVAHTVRLSSGKPRYTLEQPLPPARTYTWSVVWYDAEGRASPSSEPAAFHVGPSAPGSWDGVAWLGSNTSNTYRTELTSLTNDETLATATLYICALGYGKVSVNGEQVSGLAVVSGWTNNERLNLYESYDLTAHVRTAMQSGAQAGLALGVELGHGWRDLSKFPRHDPLDAKGDSTERVFRAQLLTTHTDGSVRTLTSTASAAASSWTAAAGPITSDSVYDGETYDARLEHAGWDMPGFALTASWQPAQTVTDAPRGAMAASAMPAIALDSVRKPVGVTNPKPNVYVVDFGGNVAGWSVLKGVKGKAGDSVVLRHAEVMQHAHLPDLKGHVNTSMIYVGNLRSAKATDTYILKGKGEGEDYTPSMTYHGARYVEVTVSPGMSFSAANIEYHHFHTANKLKATATFSSKTVTAIQKLCLGAQRSNMMTVPTDCDQRDERLGWMGDLDLSAQSMLLNYDSGAFVNMFMANMDSEMNPDGSLCDVVPLVRFGGRPGDPSWSAAYIEAAYQLWKIDGNVGPAKHYFTRMQLHLTEYANLAAKQPTKWPPTKYGDWVPAPFPPGLKISGGPKPVKPYTSAHAWIGNIQEVIELGTELGEDVAALKSLKAKLVAQWNAQWLHAANGTYANGDESQSTYTLPLHLGIVPAASKAAVQASLLRNVEAAKEHLTAGIIGGKFFFQALADMGKKDTALAVLEKTDYPSFGFMISNTMEPATENLWELMDAPYEGTGMNSRNHHMWSSISTYLVQGVAGLDQAAHSAGYSDAKFSPSAMPGSPGGGLSAASASLDLPRGLVSVDWAWEGGVQCATAADGAEIELDCGAAGGTITEVAFASYGLPGGKCGAFEASSGCDHVDAKGGKIAHAKLAEACLGRRNCSLIVAHASLGRPGAESCAPPLHAQRLHAQVTCSLPARLTLEAQVPLSSTGTLHLPFAPHHTKLLLGDKASTSTPVWSRGQAKAAQAGKLAVMQPLGVRAVREISDSELAIDVGSGRFSFSLQ